MMSLIKELEGELKKLSAGLVENSKNVLEKQDVLEQHTCRDISEPHGEHFSKGKNTNTLPLEMFV